MALLFMPWSGQVEGLQKTRLQYPFIGFLKGFIGFSRVFVVPLIKEYTLNLMRVPIIT